MQNIQQHGFGQNRSINLISLDVGKTVGIAQKSMLNSFTPGLSLSLSKAMTFVTSAVRAGAPTPTLLVVGHPVTLTGKRSLQTRLLEGVVKNMRQRLKVPIVLWDERLTTKWARQREHRAAAAWILQSFSNAIFSGQEKTNKKA
ncbi:Holliday junction resolvase-like protein [Candidatus Hodgkinia cicadicola]|nr:Holliday junction resolvase-like protein [Candidatus Hodgkinia cicadicola]